MDNQLDIDLYNELMAKQAEADQKKKLNNFIASGLDALGNRSSFGHYFLGQRAPRVDAGEAFRNMDVANPIEEELKKRKFMADAKAGRRAEAMDAPNSELSQSYLNSFEQVMPGVGKQLAGMSTNQMKEFFPLLAGARDKAADRAFQLKLAGIKAQQKKEEKGIKFTPEERKYWKDRGVSDEQINMAESGRAGRNPLGALNSIAEKDEIGTTERKALSDFQDSKVALEKIGADFFGDKDLVGVWDGNLPSWMSSNEDKVKEFRSRIGKFNDLYRKAITGTGAGEKEIKMLMANLPKENDTEKAFLGKLRSSMDDLVSRQNKYLDLLEQSGQFVGNIERMKPYDWNKAQQSAGKSMRPEMKKAQAGGMSDEDKQALEWAKKNQDDPRAIQILQKLGGMR